MSSNGAGPTIIIPARLESTRLPRKLLLDQTGKPLLQHTWEQARKCQRARRVVIATDSTEIHEKATRWGAEVVMTGPADSGSARANAAAEFLHLRDVVVNIQGDEPEVDPAAIDALVLLMQGGPLDNGGHWPVGTLACPLDAERDYHTRSVVKVVAVRNRAVYFTRSGLNGALRHIGVYAYQPYALKCFVQDQRAGRTPLAAAEDLEQLYFIEAGWVVGLHVVPSAPPGIDTAGDYEAFVKRMGKRA